MTAETTKRSDFIVWEDYFMGIAFLAAKRSKDPVTQVGACIVNGDKQIVGIGYNGMPTGCSDDKFSWGKDNDSLKHKKFYVCHAEMNAILNKNAVDVKNCSIYVGLFPCNECAKIIIQSGIKHVIYISDKYSHKKGTTASKEMFDAANVTYRQYVPKHKQITIDFSEVDWSNMSQVPDTPEPKRSESESEASPEKRTKISAAMKTLQFP